MRLPWGLFQVVVFRRLTQLRWMLRWRQASCKSSLLQDSVPPVTHSLLSSLMAASVREGLPFFPCSWAQLARAHPRLIKHAGLPRGAVDPRGCSWPRLLSGSLSHALVVPRLWALLATPCPGLISCSLHLAETRQARPALCSLGSVCTAAELLLHWICPLGCLFKAFTQDENNVSNLLFYPRLTCALGLISLSCKLNSL